MNDILNEGDGKYYRTGVVLFDFYNKYELDEPYSLVEYVVRLGIE